MTFEDVSFADNKSIVNAVKQSFDTLILKILFIILSSGGATGTGTAPIIAKIAKDQNTLTVAIVSNSFILNKKLKMRQTTDDEAEELLSQSYKTLGYISYQKNLM